MPLLITYDNQTMQDGLGSQSLRILGVFSIAKVLNIGYQHSPIVSFVEEYAHHLNNDNDETDLLREVNKFFLFPSRILNPKVDQDLVMREIKILPLLKLKIKYRFSKKVVLLHLLLPFKITDRIPLIYLVGISYLRRLQSRLLIKIDTTVVHVRRGYGYLYSDPTTFRPRHLPYEYYSAALEVVSRKFFKDRDFKLIVHTDLSPIDINFKPHKLQTSVWALNFSGVEAQSNGLELPGINLEERIRFPKNSRVEIQYCSKFMQTFLDMCNCSVLIQSKSSLSYLAGLLNRGVVIWPSSNGHSKYPSWVNSLKIGLSHQEFKPMMEGSPDL